MNTNFQRPHQVTERVKLCFVYDCVAQKRKRFHASHLNFLSSASNAFIYLHFYSFLHLFDVIPLIIELYIGCNGVIYKDCISNQSIKAAKRSGTTCQQRNSP